MSRMLDLSKFDALSRQLNRHSFRGRVLALDPGETTGWACFERSEKTTVLIDAGQIKTWPLEECVRNIGPLLMLRPEYIVYEAYHIYGWKGDQHKFSEVATIQVIGCIRTHAILSNIPYCNYTAQVGKGFCSDQKLESWGLWIEGLRHARDAIRHGAYFLLFGPPKGSQ